MCGRFSLIHTPEAVEAAFGLATIEAFPPRYNIAPTQPIMVITAAPLRGEGSNLPDRQAQLMRWGLLPAWVKEVKDFPLLINARSETADTKPSFRNAMRHRRTIVPASGFYEWQRDKPSGQSQAYWVRPKDGGIVGFAAVSETYMSADGAEIDTVALLTATSNAEFMPIHDRMPVVLQPADFSRWLDCCSGEPRHVADLLVAPPLGVFEAIAISDDVNKVVNTDSSIQTRVEPKKLGEKLRDKPATNPQGSLF
ncbi:MAG: SOS response-associated peptidase [Ahrensia sp.]|nr:SOS response-associated peptidase [Ahrensia sp.]